MNIIDLLGTAMYCICELFEIVNLFAIKLYGYH